MIKNKNAILQYFFIYLMIILNQSHIYRLYIEPNKSVQIVIIGLLTIYLLYKYKFKASRAFFISVFILASIIFVRFIKGGVGVTMSYEIIMRVFVVYAAILTNVDKFWTRFVKVVVFFAGISIIGWVQQVAGLDIMRKIAPGHVDYRELVTWNTGYKVVTKRYVYGILLYTTSQLEPTRNVGIFTEPGIYQMILNSAIFVLLFFNNTLYITKKKIKKYLLICIIALALTQSTSGYFGFAVIMLGVILSSNKETRAIRKTMLILATVGIVVLCGDLAYRGDSSLLYKAILSKVFLDSGQFDINASTGMYRMASITMAIEAMIKHPLGLGVDRWVLFSSTNELAGAGGWPFKLGAILGVVPFSVSMIWIFAPLRYIKKRWIEIAIIVFLYFNTAMAQTSAFYPTLIVVPIYLSLIKRDFKRFKREKFRYI